MKKQLLTAALALLAINASLHAQSMIGITSSNSIFTMANAGSPSSINGPYTVSGVASGQVLIGLDYRPSDGRLYALGYDSATTTTQLYTITNSGTTYSANAVGASMSSINLGSTTNASFDFVPTTDDQIRIIGRNGSTYLMNMSTGMVSTGAGAMNYILGDVHAGSSNTVAATTYTNNFYGSDATTQIGYDADNNVLVSYNPASFNNGFDNEQYTIHSIGLSIGAIVSGSSSIGMDSWYDTTTNSNKIYMSAGNILGTHLYSYDMGSGSTGTMTDLGTIGTGSISVKDIAFPTYRDSSSAIIGHMMTALSLNMRHMIFFDSYRPRNIRRQVSLSGVTPGQTMVGIDYASTGTLYGLGYNSVGHSYQLYTIDTATGNASAVNSTAGTLNLGTDNGSGNYVNTGFRFIPTATNEIRVMGNNGATNVRLNSATGLVAHTDTATQYVSGDANFGASANITSMAYTGYNGDTATQMFGFDANTGAMIKFNSGNGTMGYGNGSSGYINTDINLNTILSLVLNNSTYNNAHMNIAYDNATHTNLGFMAANYMGDSSTQSNYSVLYDMSGMLSAYHKGTASAPTRTGNIGYGTPVKDVATKRYAYTPPTSTGVSSVSTSNAIVIYPNPVMNQARIILPTAAAGTMYIDVVDVTGHIAHIAQDAKGQNVIDLDMSTFAPGVYTLNIYGIEGSIYHTKVVKQ